MSILHVVSEYLYPTIITLIFFTLSFYFRLKINRIETRNVKNIKKRDISDAVETESPIDEDQTKLLKQKGINLLEDKFSFFKKLLPIIMVSLWVLFIIIPYLGRIPSVYISILAAILSVLVGVALRPFLENLFSGVVISFFRSIKIGDTVIIDGQYGLIEEIGLTYTVLRRWDWSRIVIPNTKLMQKEVENLTMNDHYIWAHIEFFVAPDSDLSKVENIAKGLAKESKYFNQAEEPSFWVMGLQKDSIKCWLAAWAESPSDAWELRNDLRTGLMKAFQRENIRFHSYNIDTTDFNLAK